MDLISILKEYGFSDKEAKIYLAALELGFSSASTIARFCGEKRLATYDVLKRLQKRWIVNELIKDKVQTYSVIAPKQLIELKRLETEVITKKFNDALGEFSILEKSSCSISEVQFFESFEGFKQIYLDHEKSETELLSLLGPSVIPDDIRKYIRTHHIPVRIKNKVFARVICNDDEAGHEYKQHDKTLYREALLVKEPELKLSTEIVAYGPWKVSITTFQKNKMSWIIITNKYFFDSIVTIFEHIWTTHKKGV